MPLTEKELKRLLARWGIKPRADGCYHKDDFMAAWLKEGIIKEDDPDYLDYLRRRN